MQGLWVSTLTNSLVLLDFPAAMLSIGPTAVCGSIRVSRLTGIQTGTGGFPRSRRTGGTVSLCPEGELAGLQCSYLSSPPASLLVAFANKRSLFADRSCAQHCAITDLLCVLYDAFEVC